jgi:hypothetical protein
MMSRTVLPLALPPTSCLKEECNFISSNYWVEQTFCCYDKYLEKKNLRAERFILACDFRGVSPSWQGGCDRAEQLTSWQQGAE